MREYNYCADCSLRFGSHNWLLADFGVISYREDTRPGHLGAFRVRGSLVEQMMWLEGCAINIFII